MTNGKETPAVILETYKYQPRIEKRHEQLKSVYDIAPVFLKNPERIEALLFIYFVGMLITSLIERETRTAMENAHLSSIPIYPEKRQCKRPTADKVLALFADLRLQAVSRAGKTLDVVPDQLSPLQRQVLTLLGIQPESYFAQDAV